MSKQRGGFTLIELLVVIVIIGVLVGLLVPAVLAARGAARRVACVNNQQQIAKAVLHYETTKNPSHFPGYINPNNVNWVMTIFDKLGRQDIVDYWRKNNTWSPVQLKELYCPDDPPADKTTLQLSYVVNLAIFKDLSAANAQNNYVATSQIKSPAQTVMFGEKVNASPARLWTDTAVAKLTFTWPVAAGTMIAPNILASNHGGVVVVTFCDGHTEQVRDDVDCNQFYGVPTP